jgi:hypothetical protein
MEDAEYAEQLVITHQNTALRVAVSEIDRSVLSAQHLATRQMNMCVENAAKKEHTELNSMINQIHNNLLRRSKTNLYQRAIKTDKPNHFFCI